ncbi:TetR/AcrR family transcriptional regulator [Halodurantibacterium flavum]|uniref:TetR/AcrR family transcriptional regulator n=1 Tax=Halodurantibacterium flavum TaxID=1382802 RepID=A0ABW4S446_9RHOB
MNRHAPPLTETATRRADGAATRALLLDAAGLVIAEKGVERATGKEIAERAGASSNAINYHFGGMEGLHTEVLLAAHENLASFDVLSDILEGGGSAEDKMRQFIRLVVSATFVPQGHDWALPVLTRELVSPTPAGNALRECQLLPKKQIIEQIVAQAVGRPPEDPLVHRASFSVFASIVMLLISSHESRAQFFPHIGEGAEAVEPMTDHVHRFVMGGLAAIRQDG